MIKRFNHIGVAVKNLDEAVEFFENAFGGVLISRTTYEDQKIKSAFVKVGGAHFELMASTDREGLIAKFIDNRGQGIHHVSLQVDQFDKVISGLKANGLRVMSEADTDDFKAAFIHPKSNLGLLMEIIEPK